MICEDYFMQIQRLSKKPENPIKRYVNRRVSVEKVILRKMFKMRYHKISILGISHNKILLL